MDLSNAEEYPVTMTYDGMYFHVYIGNETRPGAENRPGSFGQTQAISATNGMPQRLSAGITFDQSEVVFRIGPVDKVIPGPGSITAPVRTSPESRSNNSASAEANSSGSCCSS